jgi:hypothetical protein
LLRLQPVEVIGGALRMAGGREDRAAVMLEDFEPGGDVRSVFLARLKSDFEIGAQERAEPSSATSSSAA